MFEFDKYLTDDKKNVLDLSDISGEAFDSDRKFIREIEGFIKNRKDVTEVIFNNQVREQVEPRIHNPFGLIELFIDENYKAKLIERICANDPDLKEADFSRGFVMRNGRSIYQPSELDKEQWERLIEGLARNTHLKILKINHDATIQVLREIILTPLGKALSENTSLEKLHIHINGIRAEHCKDFFNFLKKNKSLTYIEVTDVLYNENQSIRDVINTVRSRKSLQGQNMTFTNALISPEDLAKKISTCVTLEALAGTLENIEFIPTSRKAVKGTDMAVLIRENANKKGQIKLEYFTSTGGLRDKVKELWETEKAQESLAKLSISPNYHY